MLNLACGMLLKFAYIINPTKQHHTSSLTLLARPTYISIICTMGINVGRAERVHIMGICNHVIMQIV